MGTFSFKFVRKVKIILPDYCTIKHSFSTRLPFWTAATSTRGDFSFRHENRFRISAHCYCL